MARPSSTDRLVRLLSLPAWVAEHDGATFQEAASHFGVTPAVIEKDVSTLWVSGLPGGMPGDLVDFSATDFEVGRLSLTHPLGLDRPVRLSREEATSLLLSLRVLSSLLGADLASSRVLRECERVLQRLLSGEAVDDDGPAESGDDAQGRDGAALAGRTGAVRPEVLEIVTKALDQHRRLHLSYVSATDDPSERDVDPLRLESDGSHVLLRAWCLSAKGERVFRLDRVLGAELLTAPATAHRRSRLSAGEDGDHVLPRMTLHLAPTGRWLVEQVRCQSSEHHPDGTVSAVVEGRDRRWLVGLALSAGRHLLGVEPADLASEVAAGAARALERYESLSW